MPNEIKKITKDKWLWMPHAAHFICADYCNFVMATKIGKYIISTVGEYWPDSTIRRIHAEIRDPKWYKTNKEKRGDDFDHEYKKRFGYHEMGYNRTYETFIFKSRKSKAKCCPYEIDPSTTIEEKYYNKAEDAYKGHYKLCNKYSKQLNKTAKTYKNRHKIRNEPINYKK